MRGMMMKPLLLVGLMAIAMPSLAVTTVTGQIQTQLVLTSACQVNGSGAISNINFGTLDFGSQNALFTQSSAQVLSSGGGALSVQCSAGSAPVVKIGVGSHDGQSVGGTRAMYDGAGNYVPYEFYSDSGHSSLLSIGATINLPVSMGAAQTVNIYGAAVGKAGLPPGTYTDTVAVELSF